MKENVYLKQREALNRALWSAGVETGFQKAVDMFSIALNDPVTMGKDTFGKQRLMNLLNAVAELDYYFTKAYTEDKEADYLQEQMDSALSKIFDEKFSKFSERYPYITQPDYSKAKKGWK